MIKNIIIGNGINIQFDKNKYKWNELADICQKDFKKTIENINKKNIFLNALNSTWLEVEKYIPKNKKINLEDFVKYFNIFYYRDIMNEYEFEFFFQYCWHIFVIPFLNKEDYPIECPEIMPESIMQVSFFLFSLESVYKRTLKNILIQKYKINQIHIDDKVIKYIKKTFDKKITLNYDNNLSKIKDLVYLHGKFNKSKIKFKEDFKNHQNDTILSLKNKIKSEDLEEYFKWNKLNTLQEDLVLKEKSILKNNNLELEKYVFNNGFKKLLENFGIKNNILVFNKIKVEKGPTYDEVLSNLEGSVYLIGINPKNDEEIIKILIKNKKLKKIIIYGDTKRLNIDNKIEYKSYIEFWNMIK